MNNGNHSTLSAALIKKQPNAVAELMDHPGIDFCAATSVAIFTEHKETFKQALKIWAESKYSSLGEDFHVKDYNGNKVTRTQTISQQRDNIVNKLTALGAYGFITPDVKDEFLSDFKQMIKKRDADINVVGSVLEKWESRIKKDQRGNVRGMLAEGGHNPTDIRNAIPSEHNISPLDAFTINKFLTVSDRNNLRQAIEPRRQGSRCLIS